jgi:hypothetical protein
MMDEILRMRGEEGRVRRGRGGRRRKERWEEGEEGCCKIRTGVVAGRPP